MFLCNSSAIKDWSYFLSQILPLVNRTAGWVSADQAEEVTATVVTALQPHGMSASRPPLNSNHTSGMEHVFQYSYSEGDQMSADYRTPAGGSMPLPKAVLYLVMAALVVVAVAYAIVGHLLKDVVNDFVGMWTLLPHPQHACVRVCVCACEPELTFDKAQVRFSEGWFMFNHHHTSVNAPVLMERLFSANVSTTGQSHGVTNGSCLNDSMLWTTQQSFPDIIK